MSREFFVFYIDFIVFVFGAVVGSFLNVCVHRMPRGESIVSPPSHCPRCNEEIMWHDNVPLVSYLVLRARCRHCGVKISPRYWLIELLTAVLFLGVWLKFGGWLAPIYWVLIAGLIVATFIDFEHYIIPNEITYGGIVIGLVFSAAYPPLMDRTTLGAALGQSLAGVLVGGLTLWAVAWLGELIFKKEAMGFGDVKFLAAIGAFLGWEATLFTIFASSLIGGVVGLLLIIASRKGWGMRIPYGPYIALGALLWLVCGGEMVHWYLHLLGRG